MLKVYRYMCSVCLSGERIMSFMIILTIALSHPLIADDNAETLSPQIKRCIQEWNTPMDSGSQRIAMATLFGQPPVGPGFIPPTEVQRLLTERGLNYDDWETRLSAIKGFHSFLYLDPEPILPILRDGMNDNHPRVRRESIAVLGRAVNVIRRGPSFPTRWSEDTAARIHSKREELIDYILDQAVTKGLADEDEEVVDQTLMLLTAENASTKKRLRALDRVIARNLIQFPHAIKKAETLQSDWQDKLDGIKDPEPIPENKEDAADDPFGN